MTLTFRGCNYEHQTEAAKKSSVILTYRRSHYQARQLDASYNQDRWVPKGFIRSKKTAELIGLPLENASKHYLKYRGVEYFK